MDWFLYDIGLRHERVKYYIFDTAFVTFKRILLETQWLFWTSLIAYPPIFSSHIAIPHHIEIVTHTTLNFDVW